MRNDWLALDEMRLRVHEMGDRVGGKAARLADELAGQLVAFKTELGVAQFRSEYRDESGGERLSRVAMEDVYEQIEAEAFPIREKAPKRSKASA
ncbi:MAG TPA: hypothetical protein VGN17_26155 [Bryobacteraceae bacterium]|jgi:hypothetical protein